MLIFSFYFSRSSKRIININVLSPETGASLMALFVAFVNHFLFLISPSSGVSGRCDCGIFWVYSLIF